MSKRKAPSSSNNNSSHRHKKHPRLNNTDETTTQQQSAHIQSINILYIDPSTLTPAQITQQKTVVSHKLHHAIKVVSRALKVGRGFERQKLGKKLKLAKEGNDEALGERIEREIGALKEVELDGVAKGAVRKGLGKGVKGWTFFPVEELLDKGMEGGVKGGDEEKEMEKEEEEAKIARNNVVAALCNTKPVREAVKAAVEMVRDVAETKWAPEGGSENEEEEEKESVKGGDQGHRNRNDEEEENEEDDDEELEGEWSEWNGIEDSIIHNTPSSSAEYNTGAGSTSKLKSKPSIKSDISLIDPSRHADDEWSGEEDIEAEDIELLGTDEESGSTADDEVDKEEEEISEDELVEKLSKFIAPGSDEEEDEDEEDTDDTGNEIDRETRTTKKTTPKTSIILSKESKSKSSPSQGPSSSTSTSTTKPETKPKPLPALTKSTFLPSLMAGYISGSDSDSGFNDPFHPNKNRSPAHKKERKNRMGQQARRALAEKKYKDNARHIKLGLGSGKREDRVDGGRDGASRGGFGRGAGGARRGRFAAGGDGARGGQKLDRKKDNEGPLHPSWEAARKTKEMKAKAEFQGKKIKFD